MKDQLHFNATSASTIADSDKVGSHLLTSTGALVDTKSIASEDWLNVASALFDGSGNALTSGDGSSDNIANTFQGLDSRSFNYGYDSVGDNWDRLRSTGGALHVLADLDVDFDYVYAEDSIHNSGDLGAFSLAVRRDARTSGTSADGDYASFNVNSVGELWVHDEDVRAQLVLANSSLDAIEASVAAIDIDTSSIITELQSANTSLDNIESDADQIRIDTTAIYNEITALSHAEDSLHSSGHMGFMSLGVRNDAGTALAGDGDYIPFMFNSSGSLYTTVTGTTSVSDAALANTSIVNTPTNITTSATDILATDLTNRKYLFLYNNGEQKVFLGGSGVTVANGFPLSPRSYMEMRAGSAINIHAISNVGTNEVRAMELS
jgi:hypothetical protein